MFDIWKNENDTDNSLILHSSKMKLPTDAESYNPPVEYILNRKEKSKMNTESSHHDFKSKKYSSIINIGVYENIIKELFERCLDVYLHDRQKKKKINLDPQNILPQLPNINSLHPFPEFKALEYKGHTKLVRTLSISSCGQWLVTGSNDCTVRIWEIITGKEFQQYKFEKPIHQVICNPILPIFAVIVTNSIFIVLESWFGNIENYTKEWTFENNQNYCQWSNIIIKNKKLIQIKIMEKIGFYRLAWHSKGDFFATIKKNKQANALLIHKLSVKKSQQPFSRSIGCLEDVKFHSHRPYIFIASNQWIRIYNVSTQTLYKKIKIITQNISSISIYPSGNHILIGCYDCRVFWYDTDQSSKPYVNLKYHKYSVRKVDIHKNKPLSATCGDDGVIQIFHVKISSNYNIKSSVVPVQILKAHKVINNIGVLDIIFHPSEPWIFSTGIDKHVKLWC